MDDLCGASREYALCRLRGVCDWQLRCRRWQHLSNSGFHCSLDAETSPRLWRLGILNVRRHQVNHPSLSLPSFAKINWSLRILGRRPDGYHEVRTWLQTISLHDDLHFELTDDDSISLICD